MNLLRSADAAPETCKIAVVKIVQTDLESIVEVQVQLTDAGEEWFSLASGYADRFEAMRLYGMESNIRGLTVFEAMRKLGQLQSFISAEREYVRLSLLSPTKKIVRELKSLAKRLGKIGVA
jgi:hypothetical protein